MFTLGIAGCRNFVTNVRGRKWLFWVLGLFPSCSCPLIRRLINLFHIALGSEHIADIDTDRSRTHSARSVSLHRWEACQDLWQLVCTIHISVVSKPRCVVWSGIFQASSLMKSGLFTSNISPQDSSKTEWLAGDWSGQWSSTEITGAQHLSSFSRLWDHLTHQSLNRNLDRWSAPSFKNAWA